MTCSFSPNMFLATHAEKDVVKRAEEVFGRMLSPPRTPQKVKWKGENEGELELL